MHLLILFLLVFIISTLLISSFSKLLNLKNFQKTIIGLGISDRRARTISILFPIIESFVGIILIFQSTRLIGNLLFFGLSGIFLWATVKGMKKSLNCGCFGSLVPESFGIKTFIRIILLVIVNGYISIQHVYYDGIISGTYIQITFMSFLSIMIVMEYLLLLAIYDYRKYSPKQ